MLSGCRLQYEISSPNVLTMIDLGGIPLEAADRTMADPLMSGWRTLLSKPRTDGRLL